MPRVSIGPALPDRKTIDIEIARLRDLDSGQLQSRWHTAFGRRPHLHLPRHLLFRVLAYRLQADVLGDLDSERQFCSTVRYLLRTLGNAPWSWPSVRHLRPGTVLEREWNGRMHRVAVLTDGFAWNGKTYRSLTKVASAITGTRWSGPRFFGVRDKPSKKAGS